MLGISGEAKECLVRLRISRPTSRQLVKVVYPSPVHEDTQIVTGSASNRDREAIIGPVSELRLAALQSVRRAIPDSVVVNETLPGCDSAARRPRKARRSCVIRMKVNVMQNSESKTWKYAHGLHRVSPCPACG